MQTQTTHPIDNQASVEALDALLADATVFYQKLRAYHWLVRGPRFFRLHNQFEELYDRWAEAIDEVAERMLIVGGRPRFTLKQMLEAAEIREAGGRESAEQMVAAVVADLEHLVGRLNAVAAAADAAGDRGTADVADDIRDQAEKDAWMLRTYAAETA